MKRTGLMFISAAALVASCGQNAVQYDASGVFETTEVIISARGTGEIMGFSVTEGMAVRAGEPLGHLDTLQLVLRKNQMLATKKSASSRKLDVPVQVSGLRQQINNLEAEKARFQALLADGAATRKQVDDIGYQISVLKMQLDAATEQVSSANVSIDGQTAGMDAQIDQIDDQIRQAVICSPIDGVVLSKYAEPGEFAVPGRALLKVGDIGQMKLRTYVTAAQVTEISLGQHVTVYADLGGSGRKSYEGVVSWISSEAEFTPKTIQTRDERSNLVYAVKVTVLNDGTIKRGMYGDVKF